MNSFKLVSICIPTFNGSDFISETLESCKNQDYPNVELIISDDRSSDNTLELVKNITLDFPIRVYSHEPKGIGSNWNNCVRYARGEYIKFLFQDDLLEPSCISELVNLIESEPNVAMVACKRHLIIDKNVSLESNWIRRYEDLQGNLPLNSSDVWRLSKNNFNYSFFYEGPRNKIGEPTTVLLDRKLFSKTGGFREDLMQNLDFECWWRIMENHKVLITSKKLVSFRIHENQATSQNKGKSLPDYQIIRKILLFKYLWKMSFKDAIKVLIKEFTNVWRGLKLRILKW